MSNCFATTSSLGQTVCRSTLRHLNDQEVHCPIHQEMRRVFNESIAHHLGPNAMEQDFPAEDLIPDMTFMTMTTTLTLTMATLR